MAEWTVAISRFIAEFLRVILLVTRPCSDILFSYIEPIFMGKTKSLPPIQNKILLLSATELASKIRKKQLRCEDVMRAYIDRARAVQPIINAIVDARYDDALEESKSVDRFLAGGNKTPEQIEKDTPLLGVPFSCKEPIGVKGLSQTNGIVRYKGRKADRDSDTASLYRAAGAIPVTVTNVPEMSMWWDSSNLLHGTTKNPYDHCRTVGGSTGGEAALLASASALIGIGNDSVGSIRLPSCFNGVYGHKPSSWVVSNVGHFPMSEEEGKKISKYWCTGPMCRYAEDLPLLLKILSKNDQRLQLNTKVDFRNVKVYYMEEITGNLLSASPTIKQAIRKAADHFEYQCGAKVIPLKIDEMSDALAMWEYKILETDLPPLRAALADENGNVNLWFELLKSVLGLSEHTFQMIFFAMVEKREKNQSYYHHLKKFESLEKKFQEMFQEDAIFLLPAHHEAAPFYHMTVPKYNSFSYCAIFSILGYPDTIIPAGFCDGVPFGIQVISGLFKDHLTLAAAIELDKVFGGWKSPCPVAISPIPNSKKEK